MFFNQLRKYWRRDVIGKFRPAAACFESRLTKTKLFAIRAIYGVRFTSPSSSRHYGSTQAIKSFQCVEQFSVTFGVISFSLLTWVSQVESAQCASTWRERGNPQLRNWIQVEFEITSYHDVISRDDNAMAEGNRLPASDGRTSGHFPWANGKRHCFLLKQHLYNTSRYLPHF